MSLAKTVYLSNDQGLVRDFLTPSVLSYIGKLEAHALLEAELFAHCRIRMAVPDPADAIVLDRLGAFQQVLSTFLIALWVVSDHGGYTGKAFGIASTGGRVRSISSNFLSQVYSTADGKHPPSTITPDELRVARELADKLLRTNYEEFIVEPRPVTQLARTESRLTRCLYVLQAARSSVDLAVRIAFYAMCLETLFSVDAQELSHKVSERVAHFLGATADDRWRLYKEVKRGYDVRSQTVHGAGIRRDDELVGVSRNLDRILRDVLSKMLTDEALVELFSAAGDERLRRYLERLVFAVPEATP
jgi:hypothetical protein